MQSTGSAKVHACDESHLRGTNTYARENETELQAKETKAKTNTHARTPTQGAAARVNGAPPWASISGIFVGPSARPSGTHA